MRKGVGELNYMVRGSEEASIENYNIFELQQKRKVVHSKLY